MIVTCPSCQKKFELDNNLLPENGRTLQCGLCNHKWFFKKKSEMGILEKVDAPNIIPEISISDKKISKELGTLKNQIDDQINKKKTINDKNQNILRFFNYFIVLIISFVALIIFLDTFKNNLSVIFPNLELFLYNLFETVKDLKLFFNDLFR